MLLTFCHILPLTLNLTALYILSKHTLHPSNPNSISTKKRTFIMCKTECDRKMKFFWMVCVAYILSHATTHFHSNHTLHSFKPHSASFLSTIHSFKPNFISTQKLTYIRCKSECYRKKKFFRMVCVAYILSHATTYFHLNRTLHPFLPHSISTQKRSNSRCKTDLPQNEVFGWYMLLIFCLVLQFTFIQTALCIH